MPLRVVHLELSPASDNTVVFDPIDNSSSSDDEDTVLAPCSSDDDDDHDRGRDTVPMVGQQLQREHAFYDLAGAMLGRSAVRRPREPEQAPGAPDLFTRIMFSTRLPRLHTCAAFALHASVFAAHKNETVGLTLPPSVPSRSSTMAEHEWGDKMPPFTANLRYGARLGGSWLVMPSFEVMFLDCIAAVTIMVATSRVRFDDSRDRDVIIVNACENCPSSTRWVMFTFLYGELGKRSSLRLIAIVIHYCDHVTYVNSPLLYNATFLDDGEERRLLARSVAMQLRSGQDYTRVAHGLLSSFGVDYASAPKDTRVISVDPEDE